MTNAPSQRRAGKGQFLSSVKLRYLRHIVQAQILVLVLWAATNPFLPVQLLWRLDPLPSISAAVSGTVIALPLLGVGLAMLVAGLVLGRAFCGWICPLGFVQDLASLPTKKRRMPEALRYFKYAILAGGLMTAAMAGWTFLEWLTPMSVLPRGLAVTFGPRNSFTVGISVFLVAVLPAGLIESRAWCRYVCPLGAILSLPASRKAIGIELNQDKCIRCMKCQRACTMGIIDVEKQRGLRWDSECILCLACRDACPTNAIGLAFRA